MNLEALNDPDLLKYSNIAESYFNSTPTLYNLSNGVWNKIKSLYFGTKAAYKADSEMMNKYRKDLLNRGNIKRAIFGSPYVDYIENSPRLYEKPKDIIKVTKHQEGTTKGGLLIIPKAEDKYKKSLKFTHVNDPRYPINTDVVSTFDPQKYDFNKGEIRRTIIYKQNQPNDTIYSETPNYPILNQKDLKRRFNIAWNLAK